MDWLMKSKLEIISILLFFFTFPETSYSEEKAKIGFNFSSHSRKNIEQVQDKTNLFTKNQDEIRWNGFYEYDYQKKEDNFRNDFETDLEYGEINGSENSDKIDLNFIYRDLFLNHKDLFYFGRSQLVSQFKPFGVNTRLQLSSGFGYFLIDSDTYGVLENRVGLQSEKAWNPSKQPTRNVDYSLNYLYNGKQFSDELEFSFTKSFDSYYEWSLENEFVVPINDFFSFTHELVLFKTKTIDEYGFSSTTKFNYEYKF